MPDTPPGQAGPLPRAPGEQAGRPAGVTHQYDLRERAAFIRAETVRLIDIAKTGMRVRVLAHHAGISLGYYGTSHHATEDVAILRSIAGVTVVAPCDARTRRWGRPRTCTGTTGSTRPGSWRGSAA